MFLALGPTVFVAVGGIVAAGGAVVLAVFGSQVAIGMDVEPVQPGLSPLTSPLISTASFSCLSSSVPLTSLPLVATSTQTASLAGAGSCSCSCFSARRQHQSQRQQQAGSDPKTLLHVWVPSKSRNGGTSEKNGPAEDGSTSAGRILANRFSSVALPSHKPPEQGGGPGDFAPRRAGRTAGRPYSNPSKDLIRSASMAVKLRRSA